MSFWTLVAANLTALFIGRLTRAVIVNTIIPRLRQLHKYVEQKIADAELKRKEGK